MVLYRWIVTIQVQQTCTASACDLRFWILTLSPEKIASISSTLLKATPINPMVNHVSLLEWMHICTTG